MVDIISIGMLVTDTLVRPVARDIFMRDSQQVSIHSMPGGDACNVCLDAVAMGMNTALVSSVGSDANGAWLMDYLKKHDVNTTDIHVSEQYGTAQSLVLTEESGERHFLTSTEIFADITADAITDALLSEAKFLSLNSYYRMKQVDGAPAAALFRRAHSFGVKTVVDTMTCRHGDPWEQILPVLSETDIFMPSFDEARQITGKDTPEEMADILQKTGVHVFIVKLGAEGSVVFDFDHNACYRIPAFHADHVVSTVGAGDAYCAGIMTALCRGYSLQESARFASAAAALTVKCEGATGGIHSFEKVSALL